MTTTPKVELQTDVDQKIDLDHAINPAPITLEDARYIDDITYDVRNGIKVRYFVLLDTLELQVYESNIKFNYDGSLQYVDFGRIYNDGSDEDSRERYEIQEYVEFDSISKQEFEKNY